MILSKLLNLSVAHVQNGNNHSTYPSGLLSGFEELIYKITYRSAWTVESAVFKVTLISSSRDPRRCPVKQAGQGFPYHPLLQTQGLHHRGMKHLASRGERTLDSNLALNPIACGFHHATQSHLEHTPAVYGQRAARLSYPSSG